MGDVSKLFVFKGLLTMPSNVLPVRIKQTFLPIIWIFNEDEGVGIKSRLPFKIFSTLQKNNMKKIIQFCKVRFYCFAFNLRMKSILKWAHHFKSSSWKLHNLCNIHTYCIHIFLQNTYVLDLVPFILQLMLEKHFKTQVKPAFGWNRNTY